MIFVRLTKGERLKQRCFATLNTTKQKAFVVKEEALRCAQSGAIKISVVRAETIYCTQSGNRVIALSE